ncbi:MAG: hypothetical protein A2675_00220 [Candidatus Yonathbacteria bacterium RIFCSPHIGHO2_01_FULL_51_10]|uniref:NodB homology domain-containing protein n=1 Tax=Candidatus Yonathbacteria bacterium RIFCSPHIGHO2_01_FULL_51_10 TaxID=1802723 RepID=A0A1G2SAI3_9BACT|nr:MAG: hypothetical protein A2675_00220 [Candidatus Yonathbacteria bacterium RIFCSPHIGHO2_01_FULL_51_10]
MQSILKHILEYTLFAVRSISAPFLGIKEVSILCYHQIDNLNREISIRSEIFKEQMQYLKNKGYHFATLDEIVAYVKREKDLPRKTVAVTFDDGYQSVYEHAFPILKRYDIPTTIFLVDDFEGSKERRGTNADGLNKKDIDTMLASGLVQIGDHSRTHLMLDEISGEELLGELCGKKQKYSYFAYPGGHHSNDVRTAVREAGFQAAFGIGQGLVYPGDDIFRLRRNVITGTMSKIDFKTRVTKTIDWYMFIVRLFK